ncbi:TPA: D-tyrosyl-tRNA(Tyr) deacylase [Candidatus Bathyarchaeota archaeon]|nr:D-tyrosyl-tRNA(Tyr) deacylase [Candidatus Bathyarchaeota archaeon]
MVVAIAASKKDPAALNIAEKLLENYGFKEAEFKGLRVHRRGNALLLFIEEEGPYAESLDQIFNLKAIIFASRHEAESGKPTLTVHAPGNLTSRAEHGGKPKELAVADPKRMRNALLTLSAKREELGLSFDVCLEATHHGPTGMACPVLFIEIGSSSREWKDPKAGEAAAEAALAACESQTSGIVSVGFGGGHYARKHTKAVLGSNFAVGHILPKFFFKEFDSAVVKKAFERNVEPCKTALVDWKGLKGPDRAKLIDFLSENGLEPIKV